MFLALASVMLFAIVSGGCGGGGSGSIGGGNNSENPIAEELSAARAETILTLDLSSMNSISFDADGNGMPDFLDFYGIPQLHVNNSASGASVAAASDVLVSDAVEESVNVPSMLWLNSLRTEAEGGNVFSVSLVAGQEYTFEFSKNLTEDLGGVLPNVSFYDPSNSLLSLDVAEEISEVTTAAYPEENPSIICYTIKPEISGNYFVKITNGELYSGAYLDDNGELAHYSEEKSATDSVLFIYKERRNEENETGYYTNFKFKIGDETTDSISVSDIIELRKIFYAANPDYFEKVYGQNLKDDDYGAGTVLDWNKADDYGYAMEEVLTEIGVVDLYADALSEELAAYSDTIESDDVFDRWVDSLTAEALEEYIQDELIRAIDSSTAVSTSALEDEWSSIPVDITGIPYEPRYYMGRGAMAFTMLDPPGAVTIRLNTPEAPTAKETRLAAFEAATSGDLMASADMTPKASDTNDAHPITTDFYAKFINTASQTEQLSKTTANVSLATSALGISAGTGSTNNFKFGLTSSTLVIHYEETEIGYRELPDEELYKAWEKAELFDAISEDYPDGEEFITEFRNDYGDYYVSGYQYGACYDAYISITTQTSEQLNEVESKIAANLTLESVQASADISNTTKDTLKENQATIDVRIVTSGLGNSSPTVIPPSNKNLPSGDVNAMDDVFKTLADFRSQLGQSSTRAEYAPVRVKMTRWRSNPKIFRRMRKKGYKSGNIPVTVGQAERIAGFNSNLKSLRAYRNVVNGNSAINGSATKDIEERFNTVVTRVSAAGDRFYQNDYKASFDQTVTEVNELNSKFKALADRYTFYTKLVIAQKQEKETYDRLKKGADTSSEGSDVFYSYVRQMPFGEDRGGSSGYAEYAVSEYVTADINAGKEVTRSVSKRRKAAAERLVWSNTQYSDFDNAQPAVLTADTDNVFCKVWVRSSNEDAKDDRARELVDGAPAVGKKNINFYFRSGYSSNIDWEIGGQSIKMTAEDYPFSGLVTQ